MATHPKIVFTSFKGVYFFKHNFTVIQREKSQTAVQFLFGPKGIYQHFGKYTGTYLRLFFPLN